MKALKGLSSLLLILLFVFAICAQQSTVRTKYNNKADETTAATYYLRVINSEAQFMLVNFQATHPRKLPQGKQPEYIVIEIQSFATLTRFAKYADRRLTVIADGESFDAGRLHYGNIAARTENGQIVYGRDAKPADYKDATGASIEQHSALASGKDIRVEGNLRNETLGFYISFGQFTRLAAAKSIGGKLGQASFAFAEDQLKYIRELAAYLTTAREIKKVKIDKNVEELIKDASSINENASLEQTLDWLKRALTGDEIAWGTRYRNQFTVESLKGCQVKFARIPRSTSISPFDSASTKSTTLPATSEDYFSLADIDIDTTKFYFARDGTSITIALNTLKNGQKIKSIVTDYSPAGKGKPYPPNMIPFIYLTIQNRDMARLTGDAIAHAVGICKSQQ